MLDMLLCKLPTLNVLFFDCPDCTLVDVFGLQLQQFNNEFGKAIEHKVDEGSR